MKKARGSALIISLLLIAAVSGMAFGIARLFFFEAAAATRYENGAIAYYAAESGIEEGFLRYRFNQNAQVPFGTAASPWTLGSNTTFRTNLATNEVVRGNPLYTGRPITNDLNTNGGGTAPQWTSYLSQQIYDLRMGYLGTFGAPFYGHDSDGNGLLGVSTAGWIAGSNYGSNDYSMLKINRDENYKVDLSGYDFKTAGSNLSFGLRYVSGTTFNDTNKKCTALAELKLTVKNATSAKEYKAMMIPDASLCKGLLPSGIGSAGLIPAASATWDGSDTNAYSVRLSRLQDVIDIYGGDTLPLTTDSVILSVRPINFDAYIAMTYSGCDSKSSPLNCATKLKVPGGPYSYIDSTGYYAGVSRKLEANIDRQSGTLYDLYDYVIYKSQ